MASKTPKADVLTFSRLPKIPVLSSEDDFEPWHEALVLRMCYYEVDGIITGVAQPPANSDDRKDFNKKKMMTYAMLSDSVQPILGMIKDLDYNSKHSLDPHSLYQAILQWDSEISAEHKFRLVTELTTIDQSKFVNLQAFLDRALWLRRRLERAHFNIDDEFMNMLLLKGINSHHEAWVNQLLHDKTIGVLAEKDIIPLIAKRAAAVRTTSAIACKGHTQDQDTQATVINATEEKGTQATLTKAHQEVGTQTESTPVQTCNEASNSIAPRPATPPNPAVVKDDSQTNKSSDLTISPVGTSQDVTKAGHNMATDESLDNSDSATIVRASNDTPKSESTSDSKTPKSEDHSDSKSPNTTNITTPSPSPNGARVNENKAAIVTVAQDANKNIVTPSKPSTSGTVANNSTQSSGSPQQTSIFGPTKQASPQTSIFGPTKHANPQAGPITNGGPKTSPVMNGARQTGPVTNSGPKTSPVTNGGPQTRPVTNGGPQTRPVTNGGRQTGPVTNGGPQPGAVVNRGPQTGPVINRGPQTGPNKQATLQTGPVTNGGPQTGATKQANPQTSIFGPNKQAHPQTGPVINRGPQPGPVINRGPGPQAGQVMNNKPQNTSTLMTPEAIYEAEILARNKDVYAWLMGNTWTKEDGINSWTITKTPTLQSCQKTVVTLAPSQSASIVMAKLQQQQGNRPVMRLQQRPFGPNDVRHW